MIGMGWPQYAMLSFYAISVVFSAYQGKERAIGGLFSSALGVWILYMGSFFS